MKFEIYSAILIFFLVYTINLKSQTQENLDTVNYELKPKYGLFGAYNLNIHSSSITNIKGFNSCCPEFKGGFGTGIYFGGLVEYPLDEIMQLMLRVSYSSSNGILNEQINMPVFDASTGGSIMGVVENRFDVQFGTIGIEPMFSYTLEENFKAHGGFRAGLLVDHHYSHIEELVSPKDKGTFNNGLQTWNVSYGDLPDPNVFHFGLKAGLSYDLPLNSKKSMFLSPEVFYNLHFTSAMKDQSWMVHQIQLGAAVKFRQGPPPPPPPPPPMAPPLPDMPFPLDPPVLTANISVVEIDSLGNEQKNFILKIEDFISYNMRPLLTYIFFDSVSSKIPDKYIKLSPKEKSEFSIAKLQNLGPIETYYQVLNIIGMRMQEYPDAILKITGTNSNSGAEKGNTDLSMRRAVEIRDYLSNVWKINSERLPIISRNLPEKFTRPDEPGSDSENRRVELTANDPRITEPVFTVDTMRVLSEHNLRFKPIAESTVGIKNWEVKAIFETRDIVTFNDKGNVPKNLDWKLENKNGSPKTAGNIFYYLSVIDSLGQTAVSARNRIPIEQLTIDRKRLERISDKEFEYYSLILFDFGKSDLRTEHAKVVDFIKNRITPNATVYIRGYTDKIGEEDINKKISEKRAKSVANRLKIQNAVVEGIGEEIILYDNNTPEGRYYCRTVQIIIETPVVD